MDIPRSARYPFPGVVSRRIASRLTSAYPVTSGWKSERVSVPMLAVLLRGGGLETGAGGGVVPAALRLLQRHLLEVDDGRLGVDLVQRPVAAVAAGGPGHRAVRV